MWHMLCIHCRDGIIERFYCAVSGKILLVFNPGFLVFLKQFCLREDIANKNWFLFVNIFGLKNYHENVANFLWSNFLPRNNYSLNGFYPNFLDMRYSVFRVLHYSCIFCPCPTHVKTPCGTTLTDLGFETDFGTLVSMASNRNQNLGRNI